MMQTKRTIIISNRLPIRIERQHGELHVIPSEGGLATGLGSIYQDEGNVWIGWPGFVPENEQEKESVTAQLASLNLIPVFLTASELEGYYEGFSNEVLWPICHYHPSYTVYDPANWEIYQSVNEKFAQKVKDQDLLDSDDVWIHDYQLMLLPKLIRAHNINLAIGYFQHIPFPPDELFRAIPWRDELLEGLLGADLIAFHTYHDTQHFLNACSHILGIAIQNNSLRKAGRSIYVEVFPMGIDYEKFSGLAQSAAVQQRADEIRTFYNHRKFILSIDRLDYSKGILERLKAFESLLQHYPELYSQVVLYMLVVPSRDTVPKYSELRDEINRVVGHINAVYGTNEWTPISYFYNTYCVEELSALYVAADICLVTSLRDGMNLVCKEFIASKENNDGVLILSEMAGASRELIGPILVNPNAIEQIREAIRTAIVMPVEEQRKRLNDSLEIVKKFNVRHWVHIFFKRLKEIKALQKQELARRISPAIIQDMLSQHDASKRNLFLLDYDGTLMGFNKDADAVTPTNNLYETLEDLQSNPNNQVVIISGRPQDTLANWFADKDYFLVAEHGAWSNYPYHQWHSKNHISTRWKYPIKQIMSDFANRTAGAFVEEKNYSLAWHYRKVQHGLGNLRSQELVDNLRYLLPHYGLQLLMGNKVIEVKNSELNKGKAAMEIVHDFQPDFIFAIGDDATDEDMFLELPANALTVKVGSRKSAARYYIETQEEVLNLIKNFTNTSKHSQNEFQHIEKN
ncbi:bifunctional alpha,alpha-trehalose-phosphate synthase (UDP-forming)/trehalose-phosphatase [Sphingobacterium sp. DK4209]|uniref:Bifunctional alpha,alpha-trehalose-phosphate synthase (UDP-forming)/trehalose-phosphatase n=1 Tax=Sphingobacterium zhuxiongii TaxID=2662364 RepID=A0A5Q0QK29_9SPHI|nr:MULTISPECIES: bifunctional alpha,alpha-trehalose-phosphate synthase (UDP-forming)/trehalose-phosphatase [unclassified Sphingobacterium]MVZ67650.1 bifunctional alpha,alpha-trehalose-phosphate synthase (UDP-forming)/trehalose-phosphatase [Sphingobacterium sp. DK4209]QGA28240.1 bifunctional alpha,alpha-trehalose-phosphate synthase (UDP-forming)/trehalose-phosphatase [Sphingobacterium sp. dk4302]